MLDLGASINVMPTSIYKFLNFGDLEPTEMTIHLASRSVVQPLGVLEDVLVQVNELIFPVNFHVLDMEDETSGKGESQWPSTEGMKCPNSQFCFVKFLTNGVLILWGHSPSPMETLIFSLSLTMCRDGWRLKPSRITMLKFGVSEALISDQVTSTIEQCPPYSRNIRGYKLCIIIVHRVATTYHPKTNDQAEVFNREIKKFLQKMANPSQND
ncbi:hypothetical protein CR513_03896, partial [Mucuna pruriens]